MACLPRSRKRCMRSCGGDRVRPETRALCDGADLLLPSHSEPARRACPQSPFLKTTHFMSPKSTALLRSCGVSFCSVYQPRPVQLLTSRSQPRMYTQTLMQLQTGLLLQLPPGLVAHGLASICTCDRGCLVSELRPLFPVS